VASYNGAGQSALLPHYRAYFTDEYQNLKAAIGEIVARAGREHGSDVQAAFERAVCVAAERRQIWSGFCTVPEFLVETAAVARSWGPTRGRGGRPHRETAPPPAARQREASC
jgi:hypothetical protein